MRGKRLFAVSVAVVALVVGMLSTIVGAATPSMASVSSITCTAAPPSGTRAGHILGIVRPTASHSAARQCSANARSQRRRPGTASAAPYSGTPPMLYHGGPIMSTPSVSNEVVVTPIFWGASGAFASTYESVIEQFVGDAAHDSGSPTDVFSVLQQYTDSSSNHVHDKLVAGSAITDTDAFPTSGCTPDTGGIYSGGSGYTACLTDAQLQTEIQKQLTAHSLPSDYGHLYVIFLPKGFENCFTSKNGAHGGACTINSHAGTAGGFCAYHSSFGTAPTIYASLPFPIYESPTGYTCGQDAGPGLQNLNGNTDADVEVSPLSHETSESMTDPLGSAWYDSSGNEVGDDCAYIYGNLSGPSGAEYNQTINGHHYLLQEEFSNEDYVSGTSGCVQSAVVPTASILASPASAGVGQSVTFNGSGSTDNHPAGGAIASYSWNFGDTSTTVTTTSSTSHAYTASGTYDATLQVTDVDGWTSAPAEATVSVGPSLTVTGVSPTGIGAGATDVPVTISGSNFTSGATVGDSNSGVSFSSVVVQGATTITADVSITGSAALGATNVTVNEPGPVAATCSSCLTVTAGPTVSGISPSTVATGTSQSATISGASFESGAMVTVSGTGVTLSGTTVGASSISTTVSVAAGAASGARSVTVTNPDGGTGTCVDCLTVDPAPTVTAISPGTFVTGTTTASAQVSGSNFETGAVVAVSGSGVSATVSSVGASSILVSVTVSPAASSGARNLTVTNPDGGSSTCTGCLVVDLAPDTTGVSPGTFVTGTSTAAQVTGTSFQSGAVVTVSGSGVTASVGGVASSSISVTVTVTSGASTGPRDVTVTNPDGGTSTCSGCLVVHAAPSITGFGPPDLAVGTVTPASVSGTNFESGAVVSVSGTGVTVSVNSLQTGSTDVLSVTVTVAANAATGARDVIITNPDGGTSNCSGCLVVDPLPTASALSSGYAATATTTSQTMAGANFEAGATVTVSGSGVSATVGTVSPGSISISLTAASGAATGARNVTVSNPDGGSATCSGCLVVVLQQITNGGFESGSLSGWSTSGTAGVTTSGPHTGTYAALVGATTPTSGASSISQTFGIPANDSGVTFYYDETCSGTVANDWVTATMTDDTTGVTTTALAKTCPATAAWREVKAWAIPGDVYTLTVTNEDGDANPTSTKLDDVKLAVAPLLSNGGFETGSLLHWSHSGTTSVTTSNPHSGTYAALTGAATATPGASSVYQTFTVPTGSSTLSFWYDVTCPSTVTHDWATATLKDLITGTTVTVLAKTCVASSGWLEKAAAVVAGHSYTLTLTNRDDDNPATPTDTEYDDVALS